LSVEYGTWYPVVSPNLKVSLNGRLTGRHCLSFH